MSSQPSITIHLNTPDSEKEDVKGNSTNNILDKVVYQLQQVQLHKEEQMEKEKKKEKEKEKEKEKDNIESEHDIEYVTSEGRVVICLD